MRTIKKEVPAEQVIGVMERRFRHDGEMVKMSTMLRVHGFNRGLGGINYRVVADFTVRPKDGKTSIQADVHLGPSWIFWVLVIGGFFTTFGTVSLIVVLMYYLGRNLVSSNIDKGLGDVVEELS